MSAPNLAESLLRFTHIALGYDKVNVTEHGHILTLMESEGQRILKKQNTSQRIVKIMLPRASYKTTIASVSFPMWLLQQDPNLRILIDSETFNLSKNILSEIKQQYEYGPYTQFYEPINRKDTRWSEESIILPSRTSPKKEGSINAAGLDGVKAGMHYDVIIMDDIHSQNNTRSQYQIDQVIEHYRLLLPILEHNGLLIVIGTRWAENDAYDVIEKDTTCSLFTPAASTQPYTSAAILTTSKDDFLVYDHIAKNSVTAKSFYLNFPKTLSMSHLEIIEKRQGPYIFSAQYLLHPVSSKESRFREEWIQYYEETAEAPLVCDNNFDPKKPRNLCDPLYRRVGLIDPAFSTQAYSDFSGIVIMAADSERNMYVQYADQHKLEPFQLIEKVAELSKKYDVYEWYIEEIASQKVLRYFMEFTATQNDLRISMQPLKHGGKKKELRIMSLQPYFARNKVYLNKSHTELLHQLRRFPILKNDDIIDALAYAPQVVYDGTKPQPLVVRPDRLTFQDLVDELKERGENDGIRPRNFTPEGGKRWSPIV